MRKNSKQNNNVNQQQQQNILNNNNINEYYYQNKGYKTDELNIRGKPKRGIVSFQIEEKLWRAFDQKVEKQYGRYKKSYIIESLIREYMADLSGGSSSSQ